MKVWEPIISVIIWSISFFNQNSKNRFTKNSFKYGMYLAFLLDKTPTRWVGRKWPLALQ